MILNFSIVEVTEDRPVPEWWWGQDAAINKFAQWRFSSEVNLAVADFIVWFLWKQLILFIWFLYFFAHLDSWSLRLLVRYQDSILVIQVIETSETCILLAPRSLVSSVPKCVFYCRKFVLWTELPSICSLFSCRFVNVNFLEMMKFTTFFVENSSFVVELLNTNFVLNVFRWVESPSRIPWLRKGSYDVHLCLCSVWFMRWKCQNGTKKTQSTEKS